jgi:Ca-activated chloride channel homolog
MQVNLKATLSDPRLDINQSSNQRQLAVSIAALADVVGGGSVSQLPLNLGLILDCSGSMKGLPLETVKKAAQQLIYQLQPHDRLSVVSFDHQAKTIIPNQLVGTEPGVLAEKINRLQAGGGTSIDEGINLGMQEISATPNFGNAHAFILTDGENEHGDNDRCIRLATGSTQDKITLHTLGFGEHWNQNILEKIADVAGGTLAYIEKSENAIAEFGRIFNRIQSVGLNNAYLQITLQPRVRLAELKPIAQVAPDTIELPVQTAGDRLLVRIGDLMTNIPRVILLNIYAGQFPPGLQSLMNLQVSYDDPMLRKNGLQSDPVTVRSEAVTNWQAMPDANVQQYALALAKYRQTQLAEQKLQQGDRDGAATMLQTAAKTALQMGDVGGATVLQSSATQLQSGQELSESDKKKTRIVSKTILQ